ncbi:GIY-YIG nuclease family protein [Mucilaginibacter sp.]
MLNYNFYTYLLTNHQRTTLYAGVTNDLSRRLFEHYTGRDRPNSFTFKYKCYYLVWFERHEHINYAIAREKEIKGWTRIKKEKLINRTNPSWTFLNNELMAWPPLISDA